VRFDGSKVYRVEEINYMCCCGTPTINGQSGYRWQPNDAPSVRPVNAPALIDGETLIRDEPGRCGGMDSHCHHYRLVSSGHGRYTIIVRHGGGDERIPIHYPEMDAISRMDSTSCYWIMRAIQGAHSAGKSEAKQETNMKWRQAAAESRIKTRKLRGQANHVRKVWIEPRTN
jgi:hypothetical protein